MGPRVCLAIDCGRDDEAGMPRKCGELYLTMEFFPGTSQMNRDIPAGNRSSVAYWRQAVPEDGMKLGEIAARLREMKAAGLWRKPEEQP